jgi:hypothetical protein
MTMIFKEKETSIGLLAFVDVFHSLLILNTWMEMVLSKKGAMGARCGPWETLL